MHILLQNDCVVVTPILFVVFKLTYVFVVVFAAEKFNCAFTKLS